MKMFEKRYCNGSRCKFYKTSTGKISPAAIQPVTLVMLEVTRDFYYKNENDRNETRGVCSARQAIQHYACKRNTWCFLVK